LISSKMGNNQAHRLPPEEITNIVEATNFTPQQVNRLYDRFQRLDKSETGYLTREDFLRIPELAINPLAERIIDMFIIESRKNREHVESGMDDRVNFSEFCSMLSNFKSKHNKSHSDDLEAQNPRERKLRFLFKMYDRDNDGLVTVNELLHLLRLMVGDNISNQQLELIAQRTIAETDVDGDLALSFEEFKQGLKSVDVEMKMTVRFTE